jgi:hypothetical protein
VTVLLYRRQRLCPHEHLARDWGTDELECGDCHLYLGQGNDVPEWALERERQEREHRRAG